MLNADKEHLKIKVLYWNYWINEEPSMEPSHVIKGSIDSYHLKKEALFTESVLRNPK